MGRREVVVGAKRGRAWKGQRVGTGVRGRVWRPRRAGQALSSGGEGVDRALCQGEGSTPAPLRADTRFARTRTHAHAHAHAPLCRAGVVWSLQLRARLGLHCDLYRPAAHGTRHTAHGTRGPHLVAAPPPGARGARGGTRRAPAEHRRETKRVSTSARTRVRAHPPAMRCAPDGAGPRFGELVLNHVVYSGGSYSSIMLAMTVLIVSTLLHQWSFYGLQPIAGCVSTGVNKSLQARSGW